MSAGNVANGRHDRDPGRHGDIDRCLGEGRSVAEGETGKQGLLPSDWTR